MSRWQRFKNWALESPTQLFLVAFAIWLFLVVIATCITTQLYPDGFAQNIAAEMYGMLFDIILFGIILSIYDRLKTKRDEIRRYTEEIADFRGLESKEVTFRLSGLIRRLNERGVHAINLQNAFLNEAKLNNSQLSESNLEGAKLHHAQLHTAQLNNAKLDFAQLNNANLVAANLQEIQASEANFSGSQLLQTRMSFAKLPLCKFNRAILRQVQLDHSNLRRASFQDAFMENCDLHQAKMAKANLKNARLEGSNLQQCELMNANLQGTNLTNVNLEGGNLFKANLQGANLTDAALDKVKVASNDWFKQLIAWQVIGAKSLQQKYTIHSQGIKDPKGYVYFVIRKNNQ